MRALRHAPALRSIALTLAEVGAPDAVLIQLTNPLNALTACLDGIPGIRVYGFCHGYEDTEFLIARALGLIPEHAPRNTWRQMMSEPIRVEVAGNNHFMFVDRLMLGGRTYDQASLAELTPAVFDCPFREAVWSRYGVLAGNFPRHPIEFLPDFVTRKWRYGRDWGVAPVADEINPEFGDRHDDIQPRLEADLQAARADFATVGTWRIEHSREPVAEIIAAFHSGRRLDAHLNLRNQGAIEGVNADAHLEMYCRIENGGILRPRVAFPAEITAEINRVAQSQLLLAQCCECFDEEILVEAMTLDALMPRDRSRIRKLMREMIEFQRELIFPPD